MTDGPCVICGVDRGLDRGGLSPSGPNVLCDECYASAADGRAIVGIVLAVLLALPLWALLCAWWVSR